MTIGWIINVHRRSAPARPVAGRRRAEAQPPAGLPPLRCIPQPLDAIMFGTLLCS